ncbi:MAG: MBOAT family O-acyltransferase [Erysipelotrichaceae bacterium]
MAFNSYEFVFIFLPIIVFIYYFINHFKFYKLSNLFLLAMSVAFYIKFDLKFILIIGCSVVINYIIGYLLNHLEKYHRTLLTVGILFNVCILLYFKYLNFFIENINNIFGFNFGLAQLLLPIGISFFCFQQISFIVDVFKNNKIKYPFIEYALHVIFFPYIISGPIVRHNEIIPQLQSKENKKFDCESFSKGLVAFIFGLAKKVLIADVLANAVNIGFGDIASLNMITACFTMLAYTLQIYFDFSGYSDMVIGIGLMLNLKMPINFNSPYKALSIPEFWKRWHISLTRFFTDYVYIPIGGNRKGNVRTYINIFIVFIVSGLWHGANWTFILWGVMHGVGSIVTKYFNKYYKQIPAIIRWCFTFLFVNVAWVIFRSPSISEAFLFLSRLFVIDPSFSVINYASASLLPEVVSLIHVFVPMIESKVIMITSLLMMIILLISVTFMKNTMERIDNFKPTNKMVVICAILFIWSVVSFSTVTTFIYQNF